jgi:hypothetical protein
MREKRSPLESFLLARRGVTRIMRPYIARMHPIVDKNRIGMSLNINGSVWNMKPARYDSTDALMSAMWNFALAVWEQLRNSKGSQHGHN